MAVPRPPFAPVRRMLPGEELVVIFSLFCFVWVGCWEGVEK